MSRYFLGVDTGATKSHALIADENGRAIGFGRAGPGNWEVIGWDGTWATLDEVITRATTSAGIDRSQISAAGFGLAGYDWPEDRRPHVEIIHSLGFNIPFEIVNDAFIGLLAGSANGWGVAVTAGTSCNCYGRNPQGKMGRIGGSSYHFGEYSGAGELVSRALHAVAKAWSLRGPKTELTQAFLQATGAKDEVDLFGGLVRNRYHISASLAPLVFEVEAAGDQVAVDLVHWAGCELGNLALGVIRQLELETCEVEVVMSGSFYRGSPLIKQSMQATIHQYAPLARLIRLDAPPVAGGVVLAMEQGGVSPTQLRPTLIRTTKELF